MNGGINAGRVQFEVWRPKGGNLYKLVYIGPAKTTKANKVKRVILSPEVTVKAGDVIGVRSLAEVDCALQTNRSTDISAHRTGGGTPTIGSTYAFATQEFFLMNIAADFS